MAQINLLKQDNSGGILSRFSPKIVMQFFVLVLIGLIGYYGYLFYQSREIDKEIVKTNELIIADQLDASKVPNKEELFVRQQQLKNLNELVAGHLYWSNFFEPLAKVTLKNAKYNSIKASASSNQVTLSVQVPTLEDLDKYLQVFNYSEFNKNFSNLRVGGYSKIENKSNASSTPAYQFVVDMDYNKKLLDYNYSDSDKK